MFWLKTTAVWGIFGTFGSKAILPDMLPPDVLPLPKHIYIPITAMWFLPMFTLQLDNTKR
jgi:hypothetical protein